MTEESQECGLLQHGVGGDACRGTRSYNTFPKAQAVRRRLKFGRYGQRVRRMRRALLGLACGGPQYIPEDAALLPYDNHKGEVQGLRLRAGEAVTGAGRWLLQGLADYAKYANPSFNASMTDPCMSFPPY